jgi:hypothetical protein
VAGWNIEVRLPRETIQERTRKVVGPFINRVVRRAAGEALRQARLLAPVAAGGGALRQSIIATYQAGPPFTAVVGPGVSYAPWVELGRPAGERMPPPQALVPWLLHHPALVQKITGRSRRRQGVSEILSAAFVVARSIGKKGIRPRPFMAPAAAAAQRVVDLSIAEFRRGA